MTSFAGPAVPAGDRVVNGVTPALDPKLLGPARVFCRLRKRHPLLLVSLILLVAFVAYLKLTSPPPDLSPEVYDAIREGMTQREVEHLVGARPGNYRTVVLSFEDRRRRFQQNWGQAPHTFIFWQFDQTTLDVGFDADGRVCAKQLLAEDRPAAPRLQGWRRLVDRYQPSPYCTQFWISF